MAFRGLVFSKSPETNAALSAACQTAGIQLEVCDDIFSAIEKATKQPFSCVLADWSDQPEAGFLLKRARESAPNVNTLAIAIVDRDPAPAEMRDHRLALLIHRPIVPQEAQDALSKATEQMPAVSAEAETHLQAAQTSSSTSAVSASARQDQDPPSDLPEAASNDDLRLAEDGFDPNFEANTEVIEPPRHRIPAGKILAAVVALGALFVLWNARGTFFAAMVNRSSSGTSPAGTTTPYTQTQDPYFSRGPESSNGEAQLGVVSTEAEVSTTHLRKPSDLPLPTPVYDHPALPPVEAAHATIPDSLRSSAPITPPVAETVTPAQMMPVSAPAVPPPVSTQQFSEPVAVSEETERALLIHNVTPAYPPEAAAQKLHGPVILQATISREGVVEDLKIVRGSFVLSKAAIAAVKQWRFQPYTINGRAAETQTFITITFAPPG